MKNKNILKALEGYEGSFFAFIVWGVEYEKLSKKKRNAYNQLNSERRKKGNFKKLEIDHIKSYLQSKRTDFDVVLDCG